MCERSSKSRAVSSIVDRANGSPFVERGALGAVCGGDVRVKLELVWRVQHLARTVEECLDRSEEPTGAGRVAPAPQ